MHLGVSRNYVFKEIEIGRLGVMEVWILFPISPHSGELWTEHRVL